MPGVQHLIEKAPLDHKQIDCVEIYIPKRLEYLSPLYAFLKARVTQRLGSLVLDGFSIYEVDGVFHGKQLWQERSMVIRILFIRPVESNVVVKIKDLGRQIAKTIATEEEEIWICYYPQTVAIFRPNTKIVI
jgi:hypothetical protein